MKKMEVFMELDFPFVTTFVSALLAFMLGLIWYHPKTLGQKWLEARGKENLELDSTTFPFVVTFMLWILAATFFSFLAGFHEIDSASGLICLSSLLWVAFSMPPTLMGSFYTGYPFQAVAIDSAYQLAGYYVFAGVHIATAYIT